MISKEILDKLFKYITWNIENMEKLTLKKNLTKEEWILQNLACVIEEVWELSAEVRKMTKMSFSKTKCDNFKFEDLEEEIADVLITTLALAKTVWIDNLDEIIKRKIKKNNDRGY